MAEYPFNKHFGWLVDRYGVSGKKQTIIPNLIFTEEVCGRAEEAINFYSAAADRSYPHAFTFNEAISFYIYCQDQTKLISSGII